VLIEGETGTGKEGAARGIHEASARHKQPFVVVDCSAIPANLLESELFGHERGAFTGAVTQRIGAFEEAHGGTVFLDEIGELPADLQPKLLRVLERHEIRRIGGNVHRPVDVRVIAATNRNLRAEVNAGRFRSDVYFRLAVVRVPIPPLRDHLEDLAILLERTLRSLKAPPSAMAELLSDRFIATLRRANWPGNVRELRNYLERCLVFNAPQPIGDDAIPTSAGADWSLPYEDARARLLNDFEVRYVEKALAAANGRVGLAAKTTGLSRVYLYKLIHKHGLKPFRQS
jgi:DNA-binding NtrC family response regulator